MAAVIGEGGKMPVTKESKVLDHFKTFPVSSRDQIQKLFFPRQSQRYVNAVLLRMREKNLIDVNTEIKPYVYFARGARVHKRSSKLEHHLACVDFFIWLKEQAKRKKKIPPVVLAYEPSFGRGFSSPDLILSFHGETLFVEIQRTKISSQRMQQKIKGYEELYVSGKTEFYTLKKPIVWIITREPYQIDSELDVRQTFLAL
jgi:hypothetical protein